LGIKYEWVICWGVSDKSEGRGDRESRAGGSEVMTLFKDQNGKSVLRGALLLFFAMSYPILFRKRSTKHYLKILGLLRQFFVD
jgi:hypothetical protein